MSSYNATHMKKKKTHASDGDYVLVYSTDPPPKKAAEASSPIPQQLSPSCRVERKGRGGKTVSIVGNLPAHRTLLERLCGHLKKSLGCGGTWYLADGKGIIEIQGDRQEEIMTLVVAFSQKQHVDP